MNKIIRIECRGEYFDINEQGHIKRLDRRGFQFSPTWIFAGVSFHHWKTSPDITLAGALENPRSLIGGLVWDVDHGTARRWNGSYGGKLPRITNAWAIDYNT